MPADDIQVEQVRSGQRFVLVAILANLLSLPLLVVPGGELIRVPVILLATVLSVLGIVRMARGLGTGLILTVLMAMLMLVPFANLLVMLILNARATTYLRAHGLKVGLLGAKKR